jgi:deuterolysin
MFSYFALLSLTTVALALSAGDLKVSLTPVSHSVASVDDVVITAVVSNPTSNDISVITKNTILDEGSTSSFTVTKDNQDLTFTGVFVS